MAIKRCRGCGIANDTTVTGSECMGCGRALSPTLDDPPKKAAPSAPPESITTLPLPEELWPPSRAASEPWTPPKSASDDPPLKVPSLFKLWPDFTDSTDEKLTPEQAEEKAKIGKEVASLLYSIAAIQLVVGLIAVLVFPHLLFGGPMPRDIQNLNVVFVVVIAGVFAMFGLSARSRPFEAALKGTLLYGGFLWLDMSFNPTIRNSTGELVRFAILAMLIGTLVRASRINRGY